MAATNGTFGAIFEAKLLRELPQPESNPVRIHKSMTTSRIGCEQQTRRLPSAGLSSGSGP